MGAGLLVAALTTVAAAGPVDQIAVEQRNDVLELSWADTEERLQGSIQPQVPREGEPLKILLHVGSFEGPPFEGPLTISLREQGATHGQEQTVRKGAVNWRAEFVPESAGPYRLDVSFRTTRLKVLHADLTVEPRPVPRFVLWGLLGLMASGALGMGIRMVIRQMKASEPSSVQPERPAEPTPSPTSTQPSPADPTAPAAPPAEGAAPSAEISPAPPPAKPSAL